jgi:hypothetical protein
VQQLPTVLLQLKGRGCRWDGTPAVLHQEGAFLQKFIPTRSESSNNSGDELFHEGCRALVGLIPMKSVELLDHIATEEQKSAAFVRREVKDDLQKIIRKTKEASPDNYFWAERRKKDVKRSWLVDRGGPGVI